MQQQRNSLNFQKIQQRKWRLQVKLRLIINYANSFLSLPLVYITTDAENLCKELL